MIAAFIAFFSIPLLLKFLDRPQALYGLALLSILTFIALFTLRSFYGI